MLSYTPDMVYQEPPKGFWRQKDGTLIKVKDMSNHHIVSCIALLERFAPQYAMSLGFSAGYYASEHDSMGGDAAEQASDELFEIAHLDPKDAAEELFPVYTYLCREYARRNPET